jgi:hypothetical protein
MRGTLFSEIGQYGWTLRLLEAIPNETFGCLSSDSRKERESLWRRWRKSVFLECSCAGSNDGQEAVAAVPR